MSKCNYQIKYFDYEKKEPVKFECSEDALDTGLCIFHDEKYDNNEELTNTLNEKIKKLSGVEPLFCIGYKIPKIKLSGSFSKPVYFTRALINDGDFSGAEFQKIDFSGVKFQTVNFKKASFEDADFLAVEFKGKADFSDSIFKNKVNFSESEFYEANFNGSSINKAQFLGTKFTIADFDNAKIMDGDFFGASFKAEVRFIGAELTSCRFPSVNFRTRANFTGAKLTKCYFPQSKFMTIIFENASLQVVSLQKTIFQGDANFSSSNLEKVDLFNTVFKKNANFRQSTLKEVVFSGVNFQGPTYFTKATFKSGVNFKKIELQEADFSDAEFEELINFHDVLFNKQKKVIFDSNDLSKVSFKNTDLTKVRFSEKVRWAGNDGFSLVDEELLTKNSEQKNIEGVIASYRNLRKNYELRLRYEEADKFRAKEIELEKMYKKKDKSLPVSDKELLEHKFNEIDKENEGFKKKINTLEKKIQSGDKIFIGDEKVFDEFEKKMVWIFGTPRSGSTWLAKEILKKDEIKVWDESMIGAHLGAFRDNPAIHWNLMNGNYNATFKRIIDQEHPSGFFNPKFETHWRKLLRHLIMNRFISKFGTTGFKNILIKAPNESHASDIIMKCFPNSKLIFLLRDGRDVIDSRQGKFQNPRDPHTPESVEERKFKIVHFALMWNIMVNITKKAYNSHNPDLRLFVKYEELRQNPINEIKKIYKFLGFQLNEDELKKIAKETSFENVPVELKGEDKNIRKAKPGGYKDYFTEEELEIINEMMLDNLVEFDYKL